MGRQRMRIFVLAFVFVGCSAMKPHTHHLMVRRNETKGWEAYRSFVTSDECVAWQNDLSGQIPLWEWRCVP
jgi:hypothetical protein